MGCTGASILQYGLSGFYCGVHGSGQQGMTHAYCGGWRRVGGTIRKKARTKPFKMEDPPYQNERVLMMPSIGA